MEVRVEWIISNPYRNMGKYPIDRAKVDALKTSIEQTDFWDNILVRPKPGHSEVVVEERYVVEEHIEGYEQGQVFVVGPSYDGGWDGDLICVMQTGDLCNYHPPILELAYGHHRLTAIRELGIEVVDIPVKDIDDANMLRIMANENMDDWKSTPAVINETVYAAKKFIDAELAKYETWEAIRSNENIRTILGVENGQSFAKLKGTGAGQTTILAFLGGNWKQWMIQAALATLKDDKEEKVDRQASEIFKSTESAKSFSAAAKAYHVPKQEQKALAEKIVAEGRDSKREVKKAVQDSIKQKVKESMPVDEGFADLSQMERYIQEASKACSIASDKLQWVLDEMETQQVTNLSGPSPMALRNKVIDLTIALERIAPYFKMTITRSNDDE